MDPGKFAAHVVTGKSAQRSVVEVLYVGRQSRGVQIILGLDSVCPVVSVVDDLAFVVGGLFQIGRVIINVTHLASVQIVHVFQTGETVVKHCLDVRLRIGDASESVQ